MSPTSTNCEESQVRLPRGLLTTVFALFSRAPVWDTTDDTGAEVIVGIHSPDSGVVTGGARLEGPRDINITSVKPQEEEEEEEAEEATLTKELPASR